VDLDTSQLEAALAQIGQKSSTPLLQQQTQELKNGLREISSAIQQDLGGSLAGQGSIKKTTGNDKKRPLTKRKSMVK